MLSQIIFFLAIALLIALLARKNSQARRWIGWLLISLKNLIVDGFYIIFGRFSKRGLLRRQRRTVLKNTGSSLDPQNYNPEGNNYQATSADPREVVNQHNSQTSDFWRKEPVTEKLDLLTKYEEADAMFKANRYKDAERLFLEAASKNPKDARIYAKLGLIYIKNQNYNDAIESLKVAVKLDRHNPSRHYNLAIAFWGNEDSHRAISAIREAISLDPVTPKYRQFLEQMLEKK